MPRKPLLQARWILSLALAACFGCGMTTPGARAVASAGANAQGWDPTSTLMGDCPNFAQASNGHLMTVVSRDRGRGAKAGALIELYYPNYAADHLWDSYVGVADAHGLTWAHDLKLLHQSVVPDAGVIQSDFAGPNYRLTIQDAVDPLHDVHLRHVILTNTGSAPLKGLSLAAYAFFTLNDLPGGDTLRYDAANHALVQRDDGVAVALAADPAPLAWHCGLTNMPLGDARDARQVAEAGTFDNRMAAGPAVTGVNGSMRLPLPAVAPGTSTSVTLAYGAGSNEAQALTSAAGGLADGWDAVAGRDQTRWGDFLGASHMPAGLDTDSTAVYRRALVTMAQLAASNGAIIAAPTNTSPLYRFVWPRDGTLVSLALAQAGHPELAKAFFGFCEKLQRPDGGFAVNYYPDGSKALWEFGKNADEHDQMGLFAWGVDKLAASTGDAGWAAQRWPAVKRACDFLLGVQTPDGLLGPCRDLWELDTGGSWTYSNGAAWAGLLAGARQAASQGDMATAEKYREAATRMAKATQSQLVTDGRFARGLRGNTLDTSLEVANLALGSEWFGMVPENDPRLVATGAAIQSRLGTPSGGVRRHEGDTYYGGQPWPVTTGWLALHQLGLGDRAGASARLGTLTHYAKATDSLMLGEQFDESTGHWVSAIPLAWSEATYVRAALALGGQVGP